MSEAVHPAASHHLPLFITAPGQTDVLMVVTAAILVIAVLLFGILFLKLHSLPERIAHRGHKLQFEIVAVLCLLALFTHMHIFWVAALLLALVEIPDFAGMRGIFGRIAGSVERIAGVRPGEGDMMVVAESGAGSSADDGKPHGHESVSGGDLGDGQATTPVAAGRRSEGVTRVPNKPELVPAGTRR